MSDWKITYQNQQLNFKDIPIHSIEIGKQQILALENIPTIASMQENKVRESKLFSNYFAIMTIPVYYQSLISMAKILHIEANQFHRQFCAFKIQHQILQNTVIEGLQTKKAKIEVCFSRRWREPIFIVYVVFQKYTTIDQSSKIRVFLINQRGFILQAHSNIEEAKFFATITRYIKSYSKLQHIVLLSPNQCKIDIDGINILKANFANVKIACVGYRSKNFFLNKEKITQYTLINMNINNGMRVAQYNKQEISIWHTQQICSSMLIRFIKKFQTILTRQKRIKSFFKEYPYQTHQFNQRQFLIRLFSFCYNFVAIQSLDKQGDKTIMDMLVKNCIQEFKKKKKEIYQNNQNHQKDVHVPSTNSTPLGCPICKKKSTNICMKCSQNNKTKFGLCNHECFQQFHRDPKKYQQRLKNQRTVKDLTIEIPQIIHQNDYSNQQNSDNTKTTNTYYNAQTIRQLRQKWGQVIEKEKYELDHFMKMCSMNFVPNKIIDRINLLDKKISLMTKKPQMEVPIVKKQQA